MNFDAKRMFFLVMLTIQVIMSSCGRYDNTIALPSPIDDSAIDICDAKARLASENGRLVRIKGLVAGYHEFALFGDGCSTSANIYELRMTKEMQESLLSETRRFNVNATYARGTLTITGILIVEGGRLTGLPPRVINLEGPLEPIQPQIVDRIDVTTLEQFQPR